MTLAFIDFEMSFDFDIHPGAITEVLTSQGVKNPYVETITDVYKATKSGIKISNLRFADEILISLFI